MPQITNPSLKDSWEDLSTLTPGPLNTYCRIWTHATHKGYPIYYKNGKKLNVRRVIYINMVGAIGIGVIRSRCHNTLCIEPGHLIEVSRLDSIRSIN